MNIKTALHRDRHRIAVLTAVYTITGPAFAVLLIKNLGRLLLALGEEDFGTVFAALRHAPLSGPIPFVLLLSLLFALGVNALCNAGKRKTAVALGVVIGILWCFVCVCLTNVNGINFGRIIASLLQGLSNGLADAM